MPSYDEIIDQKYGTEFCYNRMEDAKRYEPLQPMVKFVDGSQWEVMDVVEKKQEKIEDKKGLSKKERKQKEKAQKNQAVETAAKS